MADVIIPFRFHPAFKPAARVFGVRPDTARVELDDHHLVARFGPWRVRTELDNVVSAVVSGPYAWPKVIGPARVSLRDRGLTFGTNPDAGVCIAFARPVAGLDPLGLLRHPSLTVTVDDGAALAELLDRSSHDERRTHVPAQGVTADELLQEVNDDLGSMTATELRRRAKERGIIRTSRLTKADLIRELSPVDRSGD